MDRMCGFGVFHTYWFGVVYTVDYCAALKVSNADMFLAHCPGTDHVESVLWRVARTQVLVLVRNEVGMAIAIGKIAAPEFLSLWHQRDPICVE